MRIRGVLPGFLSSATSSVILSSTKYAKLPIWKVL